MNPKAVCNLIKSVRKYSKKQGVNKKLKHVSTPIETIEDYMLSVITKISYDTRSEKVNVYDFFTYNKYNIHTKKHKKMSCKDKDTIDRYTKIYREAGKRIKTKQLSTSIDNIDNYVLSVNTVIEYNTRSENINIHSYFSYHNYNIHIKKRKNVGVRL